MEGGSRGKTCKVFFEFFAGRGGKASTNVQVARDVVHKTTVRGDTDHPLDCVEGSPHGPSLRRVGRKRARGSDSVTGILTKSWYVKDWKGRAVGFVFLLGGSQLIN